MPKITRQACDQLRRELGLAASPEAVAARLGVTPMTVLKRYTRHERRVWAALVKAAQVQAERATVAKALRSRMLREGRVLSFWEADLPWDLVDRLGGYNRILREAGVPPIRAGRPRRSARPSTLGLATARHWQGAR